MSIPHPISSLFNLWGFTGGSLLLKLSRAFDQTQAIRGQPGLYASGAFIRRMIGDVQDKNLESAYRQACLAFAITRIGIELSEEAAFLEHQQAALRGHSKGDFPSPETVVPLDDFGRMSQHVADVSARVAKLAYLFFRLVGTFSANDEDLMDQVLINAYEVIQKAMDDEGELLIDIDPYRPYIPVSLPDNLTLTSFFKCTNLYLSRPRQRPLFEQRPLAKGRALDLPSVEIAEEESL